MERVEFDLEEYRALRSEIIQSMADGNKIIALGLAAVGLVLTAGLRYQDQLLGFLVLGFFLPILSALVLSMWFATLEKMARASHYLSGTEIRIKSVFWDIGSVSWEAWLRRSQPSFPAELAGICLFVIIIASSIVMGWAAGGSDVDVCDKVLVIALASIICLLLILYVILRYGKFKHWLSTSYDPETWKANS